MPKGKRQCATCRWGDWEVTNTPCEFCVAFDKWIEKTLQQKEVENAQRLARSN